MWRATSAVSISNGVNPSIGHRCGIFSLSTASRGYQKRGKSMHLVLIETSGNQSYIFATNRLRENVGASELTARAGTQFVLEAVAAAGGPNLWANNPRTIHANLTDRSKNPPIGSGSPVEVILAVSGKALLLVDSPQLGKEIVASVTERALAEAAGLEVWGVVSDAFDLGQDAIHDVVKSLHHEYEHIRSRYPGATQRFQRLPVVMDCATSGLPAARWDESGYDPGARSKVVLDKRAAAQDGLRRIRESVGPQYQLPYAPDDLEDLGCDWLAVVHADGNGLGAVFVNFDKYVQTDANAASVLQRNRAYIDQLRAFSLALDECTLGAFRAALSQLGVSREKRLANPKLPIVPLVLGGDDLTVVCDGQQALKFTVAFLENFEQETRKHHDITRILPDGVTSCAGVAIIKPHFPFFAAYELAEQLLKSAKTLRPRSAIDFHILYDASNPDFERIRNEWIVDKGETILTGRPYVVGDAAAPRYRHWRDLTQQITALQAKDDDDRRRLPNSMLHELREGLFLGRRAADARLKLVLNRYWNEGLDRLVKNGSGRSGSLFWNDGQNYRSALLDAMDAVEFW